MNDKTKDECELIFKVHNEKVEGTIRRVEALEIKYNEMIKLSTLLELQMENNKEQDKFLRQQSETLVKMNENLTSLNNITKSLEKRLSIVEVDLQKQKVENIKDRSINVVDLAKNIVIGGLILYIFMKLGLN